MFAELEIRNSSNSTVISIWMSDGCQSTANSSNFSDQQIAKMDCSKYGSAGLIVAVTICAFFCGGIIAGLAAFLIMKSELRKLVNSTQYVSIN